MMQSTDSQGSTAAADADGALSAAATLGQRRRNPERTLFLRRALADTVRRHPGVADVTLEFTNDIATGPRLLARIVPDPRTAEAVVRLLEARRAGLLDDRKCHTLPDGTIVAHQNKGEANLVYKEIFQDSCYFKHGVVVKDGDCVFDVGANIGLFSLHLNRQASGLRIFAFEPLPPLYRLLQVNRAICAMQNVHAFAYGLSHTPAVETLTYYPHNSIMSGRYADPDEDCDVAKAFLSRQMGKSGIDGADVLPDSAAHAAMTSEAYDCELKTLSQVMAEHGLHRIDLLKIGVEKSELDVLHGIRDDDWPKIRQVVVEVYDGGTQLMEVRQMLRQRGFQVATEQGECLSGTRVHMVYATRPDARQAVACTAPRTRAEEATWRNNPRLLAEDVRRHVETLLPGCYPPVEVVIAGSEDDEKA